MTRVDEERIEQVCSMRARSEAMVPPMACDFCKSANDIVCAFGHHAADRK